MRWLGRLLRRAGMAEDQKPSESAKRWRFPEGTVGAAAFVLSLTIALISLIEALRGPEIDLVAPDQILAYKSNSVLNFAIRVPMINKASGYNDMISRLTLQIERGGPEFSFTEMVTPIFNDEQTAKGSKKHCLPTYRCQSFAQMAISQQSDDVVTVPAGGAHALYYGFELYCEKCTGYETFEKALEKLGGKELDIVISLSLYSDGERTITCRAEPLIEERLLTAGWQTLTCEQPTVRVGKPV